MVRIIIGLIALVLTIVFGIFGLPIIYRDVPSYGSFAIIALLILMVIAYLCLDRPIRDYIEENF